MYGFAVLCATATSSGWRLFVKKSLNLHALDEAKEYKYVDTQLKHVESALDYLDAGLLSYQEWAKIGRSIADFDNGGTGFSLFDDWCAKDSGRYFPKKVLAQWKSFAKKRNITIATLFYMAKQAGWEVEYDSPEEYRQAAESRKKSNAEREAKRAIKAQQEAIEDAKNLANNRKEYLSLPLLTAPDPYLQRKQLHTAHNYIEIRQGNDGFLGEFIAWPLYDIDGNWAGYERIFHTPKQTDQNNKMVGKFSRNDIGFNIFGDLDTSERVFVMGGFADALTGHICTGFTTVIVAGESCIPLIINQLRERYPEKDFVTAPDNDKTGYEVKDRAGGEWVIPMGANDWSDLYLSRGTEDVRRQLSVAYGWKQVTINHRYLDINIRRGMPNKIKSPKGTAKTTVLKKFVRENPELKTLIVSYRVSLLKTLADEDDGFDADIYSDPTLESPGHNVLHKCHRLVCSMDSLWKLAGSHWDLVIMDECEQDFQHLLATTMQNKTLNTDVLAHLIKTAHTSVFMDADLGPLTNGFLKQIDVNHGVEFINNAQPRQDSTITSYETKDGLTIEIMKAMAKGEKIYICSNVKDWLDQLAEKFAQDFDLKEHEDMMLITSVNSQSKEVAEFLSKANDPEYIGKFQVLMGSPSIGTGLDLKEESHPFTRTFAYFSHNTGTAEQAHQQLARARGITDYHVHVRMTNGSKITNPDLIRQLILDERSVETAHFLGLDVQTGQLTCHPLFEWLFCHTTAILNDNFNRFAIRFEQLARAEGYKIDYVGKNKRAEKSIKEEMTVIKDELKERYTDNTEIVPVLSKTAKDDAHAGSYDKARSEVTHAIQQHYIKLSQLPPEIIQSDLDKLVNIALSKSQVMQDMNLGNLKITPEDREALLNDLTVEERYSRRVSSFKKLSRAFIPKDAAKQMDMKDHDNSRSRAELRHNSLQRRLMLKLLAAAGIDEHMNLDPEKEWGPKTIKKLMKWMQRNRNDLFKYLNITLSESHFMEPVRWFNSFLRSLNLTVESVQRRTQGSGDRFRIYRLDPSAIRPIRELTLNRVEGIVAHLNEVQAENYAVKGAQARMEQSAPVQPQPADNSSENSVTSQPINYINNRASRVTGDIPMQASVHAGFACFEEENCEPKISIPARTSESRTMRERAMDKIREWFPDLKKETGSDAHKGITDGHLEGYLSDTDIKEIDSGSLNRTGVSKALDIWASMGGKKYFES